MKSGLLIIVLAVALSGCTGSNRGNRVEVFSEVPSPAEPDAHIVTDDSPATNTYRRAQSEEVIQAGNVLLVSFSCSPRSGLVGGKLFQVDQPMPAFEQRVKGDGTITLLYNREFQAAGKKAGELETEIRNYYVPNYFIDLTVGIGISAEFVYVDGAFRKPGHYAWTNGMRLNDAIEAAGGFTEFSNHRIKLIHVDGTIQRFRLRGDWVRTNNPALKAEDRIYNPRQLLLRE